MPRQIPHRLIHARHAVRAHQEHRIQLVPPADIQGKRAGAVVQEGVAVQTVTPELLILEHWPLLKGLKVALVDPQMLVGIVKRLEQAIDQVTVNFFPGNEIGYCLEAGPSRCGVLDGDIPVEWLARMSAQQRSPSLQGNLDRRAASGNDDRRSLRRAHLHPITDPRLLHSEVERSDIGRKDNPGVVWIQPWHLVPSDRGSSVRSLHPIIPGRGQQPGQTRAGE